MMQFFDAGYAIDKEFKLDTMISFSYIRYSDPGYDI